MTLAAIMEEVARAKSDLSLHIQVANVGLTKTISDGLAVNAGLVRRVDSILQQVLGKGQGLEIAKLLGDEPTQGTFERPFQGNVLRREQVMAWCL